MKFKGLIRKFGYGLLSSTCEDKKWKIPFVSEIRKSPTSCEHKCFWVADVPEKEEDRETHACVYCVADDVLLLVNKNHMKHAVVIVKE